MVRVPKIPTVTKVPDPTVFRDFTLSQLTDKGSGKFLRALAASQASITCCFTNASSLPDYRYVSMFFRLRFPNQSYLDKFHSLGFETTDPPKISPL